METNTQKYNFVKTTKYTVIYRPGSFLRVISKCLNILVTLHGILDEKLRCYLKGGEEGKMDIISFGF